MREIGKENAKVCWEEKNTEKGEKGDVTVDRIVGANATRTLREGNNVEYHFRGVHVDLAINVPPLMALRTRLDFRWKIPEENFYCKSWPWWRGQSQRKRWMARATNERRLLQDVQLSPRFERNGSNVTIHGRSMVDWLRARFPLEASAPSRFPELRQSSTRFLVRS